MDNRRELKCARDRLDAGVRVSVPLDNSRSVWMAWSLTIQMWSYKPLSFEPLRSNQTVIQCRLQLHTPYTRMYPTHSICLLWSPSSRWAPWMRALSAKCLSAKPAIIMLAWPKQVQIGFVKLQSWLLKSYNFVSYNSYDMIRGTIRIYQ